MTILYFSSIILLISCKKIEKETIYKTVTQEKESITNENSNKIDNDEFKQSENFLKDYANPKSFNPLSLLDSLRIKKTENNVLKIFTIVNEFPENWVKYEDIEKLIILIDSKENCKCLVNPLSSNIPTNEKASIGGYAVLFIKSFKNKSKIDIGLYCCPETSEKEISAIKKWWNEYQKLKPNV